MSSNKELVFPIPVFRLPFRVFFLLAALCGIFAVLFWIVSWFNVPTIQPYLGLHWWHGHEMLFGFVGAVLVGFILTAAKNWTGSEGIGGIRLVLLSTLWLLARFSFIFNSSSMAVFATVIELIFWLYASFLLAQMLLAKRMWRNMIFVVVLLSLGVLSVLSTRFIYESYNYINAFYSSIMLVVLAVTVIAGRIIPFFTASATGTPKVDGNPFVEISLTVFTLILLLISLLVNLQEPSYKIGAIILLIGLIHLIRFVRWPIKLTLDNSMLWSLYLGYFLLVLGLFHIGLFHLSVFNNLSAAFHTLTIGSIGLLIFSMMSRVSMGHTGRKILSNSWLNAGFGLLAISAFVRGIGLEMGLAWELTTSPVPFYAVSATCWIIAFSIWIVKFAPILSSIRADGKQG